MKTELIDLSALRPSTYNPRQTDPKRLGLIELSLRKLGFLLPLYADQEGELVSGHQRLIVSEGLGLKKVPRAVIPEMDLDERKAVNILFNRATNDFIRSDTSAKVTRELLKHDLDALAMEMNDVDFANPREMYPCLYPEEVSIHDLIKANRGRWNKYASNVAGHLIKMGIEMPIILGKDNRVINGIGRLEYYAEKGFARVPVVYLDEQRSEFARLMLNLISMDFDIHRKYEDLLRYNSFRRAFTTRGGLGVGIYAGVFGDTQSYNVNLNDPEQYRKWTAMYGKKVLDFGAGRLTDTMLLRESGIEVVPFEPYYLKKNTNTIDKEASIVIAKEFLEKVESGYQWDTIFISSVLNSVPFLEDRKRIIRIVRALMGAHTKLVLWTMNRESSTYRNVQREYSSKAHLLQFALDYEDGILLGDFVSKPKVQKFHTKREMVELLNGLFRIVKVKAYGSFYLATCMGALPLPDDQERLEEAIRFEFELPYPDGSRMGLSEEALEAFAMRHKKMRN